MKEHATLLLVMGLLVGTIWGTKYKAVHREQLLRETVDNLEKTTAMLNTTTSNLNWALDQIEASQKLTQDAIGECHRCQALFRELATMRSLYSNPPPVMPLEAPVAPFGIVTNNLLLQ